MNWSDLQPGVRLAIIGVLFLVIALVVWTWVVAPLRARESTAEAGIVAAERQLEQLERGIESVPPASQAELNDWQTSRDALLGQLGPESELPVFIEALTRLAESEGVEAFLNADDASTVAGAQGRQLPSQSEQVIGTIPGARRVPLSVTTFGDYASTSRFVAQIGRLGWVTEIAGLQMQREFPEVVSDVLVIVYFRADGAGQANGAGRGGGAAQPMGAQGGGSHG